MSDQSVNPEILLCRGILVSLGAKLTSERPCGAATRLLEPVEKLRNRLPLPLQLEIHVSDGCLEPNVVA